jgi:pyrroline-5-carboxylate reductase
MPRSGVILVGCGKMGGALLAGWLARGPRETVHVVEPMDANLAPFRGDARVVAHATPDSLPADLVPSAIVLATKPQGMDQVLAPYRARSTGAVVVSIAAGRTLGFLERHLGRQALVRSMPNTPAQVGRAITVAVAHARVGADQRATAHRLLEAVGEVAWVEDEGLIDAVTAVSGSGPAYVFHFVEALARAGAKAGLPDDLAMRLARATVAGAGELLHRSSESAATLRQNVTSPGGTTAAALAVLMAEDGLGALVARAVDAAARRSRELNG